MRLGVNIDHVATLREARKITVYPSPVLAALIAQSSGADSIVAHLREDRRHIKESDVFMIKENINIELNLEMSINKEIVEIACRLRPAKATIVPEKRQEITTEGGFDVIAQEKPLMEAVERLDEAGIEVSVFIDPLIAQLKYCGRLGIRSVELHTGAYAGARTVKKRDTELKKISRAAVFARGCGFFVAAGHGLHYDNAETIASIKAIEELNIGHSIIARSVFCGLGMAVRQMRSVIDDGTRF